MCQTYTSISATRASQLATSNPMEEDKKIIRKEQAGIFCSGYKLAGQPL
jgi:hypothetical protein